jgi:hypothetical protein
MTIGISPATGWPLDAVLTVLAVLPVNISAIVCSVFTAPPVNEAITATAGFAVQLVVQTPKVPPLPL